jgi:hypothetical protein
MSITDLIGSSLDTAFTILGELVPLGIYYRPSSGAYDPLTDSKTGTPTQYANIRMLPVGKNSQEITASPANVSDLKILIPSADLPVIPQQNDYVFLRGVFYNIEKITTPPSDKLHILECRKR